MLRSFLIRLSKSEWARQTVMHWPVAFRAASRFVAGETLADGIQAVKALNAKGINATLDHLGEHTYTAEEARKATDDILGMLDAIQQAGVRSNVSIKLSQIGMVLDEALCLENLERILRAARQRGNFVRIDMEDSPWTTKTIAMYCQMRDGLGLENTGIVIQSYLYRSEADIRDILQGDGKVRLCKGAYKEPAEVAFPKKSDVDSNYDKLAAMLMDHSLKIGAPQLSADGRIPPIPAIASHDPARLEYAKTYARQIGLPKGAVEFQMLYGIRRDLQDQIAQEGYPVRIYVPYGTHWYPYYMRRLAESPANVKFFVTNLVRK